MNESNEIEVKKSYQSEVRRALALLGYGSSAFALEEFSAWVSRLEQTPQTEEAKATWTEAMLRMFGSPERPATPETVAEAGHAAWHMITLQQRFFPPRPRTGLDDGPTLTSGDIDELQDAKREFDSACHDPESPWCEHVAKEAERWRDATGCKSSEDAKKQFDQWRDLVVGIDDLEWCKATSCLTATGAGELIRQLRERVEKAERAAADRRADEKDFLTAKLGAWESCTGCNTPNSARDMIAELRDMKRGVTDGREQAWIDATGRKCPGDAERRIEEATENARRYLDESIKLSEKAEELSAKLAERDQDLLSAHTEIDHVRKAAQTLGLVSDQSKELLKVRAELATKCREAQTERERADEAEKAAQAFRSEASKWENAFVAARKSAGLDDKTMLHVWCRDAREKLAKAIVPLPKPDKVEPGQKWAFVMTCTREDSIGTGHAVQFIDASGCGYAAFREDIASGFYLGS